MKKITIFMLIAFLIDGANAATCTNGNIGTGEGQYQLIANSSTCSSLSGVGWTEITTGCYNLTQTSTNDARGTFTTRVCNP